MFWLLKDKLGVGLETPATNVKIYCYSFNGNSL